MYIFGNGILKEYKKENLLLIFNKLKPFLKHGTIILASNFQNSNALISPTIIKHSCFSYIEDNNYYIIEVSESSILKKMPILDFLKKRDSIFLFDFYDKEKMNKTIDYIMNYKDFTYGFFGKNQNYCYKIIFDIYNDVSNNKYKKMSEFFPVFKIFGMEFVNSQSIMKSKKFIPTCCIIGNKFITFKNKEY